MTTHIYEKLLDNDCSLKETEAQHTGDQETAFVYILNLEKDGKDMEYTMLDVRLPLSSEKAVFQYNFHMLDASGNTIYDKSKRYEGSTEDVMHDVLLAFQECQIYKGFKIGSDKSTLAQPLYERIVREAHRLGILDDAQEQKYLKHKVGA